VGLGLRTSDLGADPSPQPRALPPQGRVCGGATRPQSLGRLERQVILTVVVDDVALLTSLANGQLCRAFGALGLLHDLLSQLTVAKLSTTSTESLRDVCGFNFIAGRLDHRY